MNDLNETKRQRDYIVKASTATEMGLDGEDIGEQFDALGQGKPTHGSKAKLGDAMKPSKIATAYHEAGHAVVCHRLGVEVKRITIVPSNTFVGLCTHENILRRLNPEFDNSDRCRMRLERTIMICLAGQIAQRKWRSRSVKDYHAHSDYTLAVDLAFRLNGSTRQVEAYLKWLSLRTEGMLEFSWPEVEAMATDLLKHGTITVKRPTSLAEALARKFFWR